MGVYVAKERHILVVNDEDSTLFGISIALRVAGYRVSIARDGMDAISLLELQERHEADPIDLLITDWSTSKIQGAELVSNLMTRGLDLPMIVMTGLYDFVQEDWRDNLNLRIMRKPFLAGELIRQVDDFFRKSRQNKKSCIKCKTAVDERTNKGLIRAELNNTG